MKRLIHIIPYRQLYPPQNGGQLRCFHLMDQLSKYYTIDSLIFQDINSIKERGYCNDNITFYNANSFKQKGDLFSYLPKKLEIALRYRWQKKSFKGPAEKTFLDFYPIIKKLAIQNQYDIVIFEHLAAMELARPIRKFFPKAQFILDAHNVDHILHSEEQEKSTNPNKEKLIKRTYKQESNLYKYVNTFFACSEEDKKIFEKININKIKGITVPNGVDIESKDFITDCKNNTQLLFCGALNTIANRDGLIWFLKEIWPELKRKLKDIQLTIIGSGQDNNVLDRYKSDKQIYFKGFVESLKNEYANAAVSIVPLNVGSGTRLKILESMAYGIPVVSTAKGAEGVHYPENSIIITDNKQEFIDGIIKLTSDKNYHSKQRLVARKFVEENYSWVRIVNDLNNNLESQ